MKNLLLILTLFMMVLNLKAQSVPQEFTYQAIARNAEGQPIANQDIKVKISILEGSPSGSPIYSETYATITNKFGLFILNIGMDGIDWENNDFYLQTELDSGNGFLLSGTGQILSVPYSIVAQRAIEDDVNDADADPANELQELSFDTASRTLMISEGNSVIIPDEISTGGDGTDDQVLTLNGTNLSIEDGNSVNLSVLQDGVTDADADPTNEYQTLIFDSISRTLTISEGNSVVIPDEIGSGGSGTDDQQLSLDGTILSIENGNSVNLTDLQDGVIDADADPTNELQGLQLNGNTINIVEGGGSNSITLPNASSLWKEGGDHIYYDEGDVYVSNSSGEHVVGLGPLTSTSEKGILRIYDNTSTKIELFPSVQNVGMGFFYGENGSVNCMATHLNGFPNQGYFAVTGSNGLDADLIPEAGLLVDGDNNGQVLISGTYIFGETAASLYVDESMGATAEANIKLFVIPHPKDESKEISYACLEGPEAGAYERGTAKLENGEAWVSFSEHFELVINPKTITVNLTPLSVKTSGLAVVEKTANGIRVKELEKGKGNFEFDWEVKAVRKGYENFKPIRQKRQLPQVVASGNDGRKK